VDLDELGGLFGAEVARPEALEDGDGLVELRGGLLGGHGRRVPSWGDLAVDPKSPGRRSFLRPQDASRGV